jgi:hypothetical protein
MFARYFYSLWNPVILYFAYTFIFNWKTSFKDRSIYFFKKVAESTQNFDVFCEAIFDCWIGITGSAVLSGKLSLLENLLHLVHLFYTSNLNVWFAL